MRKLRISTGNSMFGAQFGKKNAQASFSKAMNIAQV